VSPEKNSVKPRFCPMDRAVAYSPAGSGHRPARSRYLGTVPPIVKRLGNELWAVVFSLVRGPKATILPEYAVTLSLLTAW
jgi:hypothetical protein